MTIRNLSPIEDIVAKAVVELGSLKNWEFAAYLEKQDGPLIEIITRMKDNRADPSADVLQLVTKPQTVIVHHNHLSQESLSRSDWNGASKHFAEIFAHCSDGTIYWGAVKSKEKVNKTFEINGLIDKADDILAHKLRSSSQEEYAGCYKFGKEIINRAMKLKMYVDYKYCWGDSINSLPLETGGIYHFPKSVGGIGKIINSYIDDAAKILSRGI